MTTELQGIKQNPDLIVDDLRRMAASINDLIKDTNRRASEFTKLSVTASRILDDNYTIILVDSTSGAVTITLPAAASYKGRHYYIKKIDSSVNAVTIDGNGSETIDDQLTAVITVQYTSLTIFSDGTEWWII
jgi:hypothetical protein